MNSQPFGIGVFTIFSMGNLPQGHPHKSTHVDHFFLDVRSKNAFPMHCQDVFLLSSYGKIATFNMTTKQMTSTNINVASSSENLSGFAAHGYSDTPWIKRDVFEHHRTKDGGL